MDGQWVNEPNADIIQKFFRVLVVCHIALPDVNKETGELSYEAESPDEAAFVIAARELGFEFFQRTQTSISLHELENGKKVDRSYVLLNMIEFSSARKRMSVIVRNSENQLLLLCKGADSVMFDKLSKQSQQYEDQTKNHINKYAEAGLRTLVIAYRPLDEEEYRAWAEEFLQAKNSVSLDRDDLVVAVAEKIERDLILLGATAVEDKLQKGVSMKAKSFIFNNILSFMQEIMAQQSGITTLDHSEMSVNALGMHNSLIGGGGRESGGNLSNQVIENTATSNKDVRFRRTSSYSDADVSETASFSEMLKSNAKKAAPFPDAVTALESADGQGGKTVKKKGEEGRQIDPALLGF